MPKDKDSTTAVITGSTGNAVQDMTPRSAYMAFATGSAGIACYAFSTDATLTALIFGVTMNGAFLSMGLFDVIFKGKLS